MASGKVYNSADCIQKLSLIQCTNGKYGGYKQELLPRKLNDLEQDFYICTKCNGIMRNACLNGDGRNLVCEMCTDDGEGLIVPMVKPREKIAELNAKCPLEKRGCEWRGNLKEIDNHLNLCSEFVVDCLYSCGVMLKRSELKNHWLNECLHRKVNCTHCKLVMLYEKLELHFTICPKFPLLCPNDCKKTFLRNEMTSHIENQCPTTSVYCRNHCGLKMKRFQLPDHCENECQLRKVKCIHCQVVMKHNEMENHLKICPNFPLLCPNECMGTFLRKEINSHIEKECPNTVLDCPNECGLKMKRSNLSIHCENECQHREIKCEYCEVIMQYKYLGIHHKICPQFPVVCPYECLKSLIRKELESHIKNECPNTLVACPYKELDCEVICKRCELPEHERKYESKHLKMRVLYYSDNIKKIEKQLQDKDMEIVELNGKVKTLENSKDNTEKDNEQLTHENADMILELREKDKESGNMKDEIKSLYTIIQCKVEEVDYLTKQNRRRAELQILADVSGASKGDDSQSKLSPRKVGNTVKEPKPEVLPAKRQGDLKIGFLYRYVVGFGLVGNRWERNLVALGPGGIYSYKTAEDYVNIVVGGVICSFTLCDRVSTYRDDQNTEKPKIPPGCSEDDGFVVKTAGASNYFIAYTMEDVKEWIELIKKNKCMCSSFQS